MFRRCTTISELMINEQIRDREVRLIGQDGEQLGVMPITEAMKLAREAELDLVKIAPTAKPPVCKIIDYGKYRYEQARKEKESSPRKEAFAVRQASLRNGLILGISATILNDSTMRVELYDGSTSLGRYDFPRVNDEIASEDAKFEMVISGDVTQAILSSPMQA